MGADTVTALHRITRLPLDPAEAVFAHYSRMKLGVVASAQYYAERLAPLAERLIKAGAGDWILTAPPLAGVPAGANMICRSLFGLLQKTIPVTVRLSLVDIRTNWSSGNARQSRHREDYSRMSLNQRLAFREADSPSIVKDRRFSGRSVLFVNDINVTGTQQRYMRRYFDALAPMVVHWLYVIDVDEAIGRSQPQLEYAINRLSHASFEEFAELIAREEMQYTGKCLARLFSYPTEKLDLLFGALDASRTGRIFELAHQEGRFHGEDFTEKMDLLSARHAGA